MSATAPMLRALPVALTLGLVLAGCSSAPADRPTPLPASTEASAARESSVPTVGFTNPVWDTNFPDPMIADTGQGYLAVATNGNGANVQTLTSTDLVTWRQGPDALPSLPEWTTPGKV